MLVIQGILLTFIIFAVSRTVLRFKEKTIRWNEFLFWLLVWGGSGVLVVAPDLASRIANLVGVGRGVDVVIYLALALIFYLLFRGMVMLDQLDQDISNIVTKLALKDLQKEQEKK